MRVSAGGRAKIRLREGCKLSAYPDSKGVWTIGVGHVDMTLPVTRPGMRITMAQADALLAADLALVEAAIARSVLVPLSQNQCDALASLAWNIGIGGFERSTVVHRLNQRDYAGAADAFMLWAKPAVLYGRRKDEKKQFLTPDAPQEPILARKPVVPAPIAPVPTKPAPSLVDRLGPMAPAAAAPIKPVSSPMLAPRPDLLERLVHYFGKH